MLVFSGRGEGWAQSKDNFFLLCLYCSKLSNLWSVKGFSAEARARAKEVVYSHVSIAPKNWLTKNEREERHYLFGLGRIQEAVVHHKFLISWDKTCLHQLRSIFWCRINSVYWAYKFEIHTFHEILPIFIYFDRQGAN